MSRELGKAALVIVMVLLVQTGRVSAQSYGIDARTIAMGGVGDRSNLAWDLVPQARGYRAVPIPLGLFQTLGDLSVFDPGSDDFNPAKAISYASNPLHYTINRGGSKTGQRFIMDLANGNLDPDLSGYSGFAPRASISTHGLAAQEAGKTFWLFDNGSTFHGVYAGAGPYLSLGASLDFDPDLIDLFGAPEGTTAPDVSFAIRNATSLEAALSFTGGYRMKLPLPGGSATRDGVYVAVNYSHLYGLHHDDLDLAAQLDTDGAGNVTSTSAVSATRLFSSSGTGRSVDLAVAVVVRGWELTGAVEGLGNHIDWRDLGARQYTLSNVSGGIDFVETPLPSPVGTLRTELPIRYSGGATFDAGGWATGADLARGLDGIEFRGGVEVRLGFVDVRGGGRLADGVWRPTTGFGLNLTRRVGIDVAMLSTTYNIERLPETGLAVSLRIGRDD